jgi:predicted nucleotidyltransferase
MLFKTIHGSNLYGLAHEGSDLDYYVVTETRRNRRPSYARQTIVDGVDTTTVDFGTWMNMCQSGVPQALEAMFSTRPVYEGAGIKEFRRAFVMGSSARDKYYRTIDNFLEDADNFKKKRHAVRLSLNLRDGMKYGRFNPTLTKRQAVWTTYHAKYTDLDTLREMCFNMANA